VDDTAGTGATGVYTVLVRTTTEVTALVGTAGTTSEEMAVLAIAKLLKPSAKRARMLMGAIAVVD